MEIDKFINENYRVPQDQYLDDHLLEILSAISSSPDKVVIDCRDIDIEEVTKIKTDPTYLQSEYLKFVDGGVKILVASQSFFEKIKNYIPRTIRELTIPKDCLSNLDFLRDFPNLETITFSDYSSLTTEELDQIRTMTNIKKINFRSSNTFYKNKNTPNYNIIFAGDIIANYKGLTLATFPSSTNHSKVNTIYIDSFTDLATIKELYKEIGQPTANLSSVYIYERETPESEIHLDFSNRHAGSVISLKNVSCKDAASLYHTIKRDCPVSKVTYYTSNKTLNDAYYLNSIAKSTDLFINYQDSANLASSTSFQAMRATIDYYKELIGQADLSPVEQLTYVYDILKTWRYQESNISKNHSRSLHSIISEGNIVCVGYALLAKTLLNELGIKAISISPTIPTKDNPFAGHQRNLVRLDDDKYNIHGIYAFDVTWDSDRDVSIIENDTGEQTIIARPSAEMKSKVIKTYDNLALYRYFLIPMSEYDSRFPGEINPTLVDIYNNNQIKELLSKQPQDIKEHANLFEPDEGLLTIGYYLTAPKPSLEMFKEILVNVRRAEGYSPPLAEQAVSQVIELHQMLNNQNKDQTNHFFKPKTK